jgi:uncharacterized protein (TIGR02680 family)
MSDTPHQPAAAVENGLFPLDSLAGEPAHDSAPSLPSPGKTRWQPLRSGLLNLYRYDEEEFVFEHGRLLIRGNNGTGKSRVLALQLPFLLDGETRPDRVEPDGDSAKRIEWNLLLGKYPDRLGYTWIEFGRRDADGGKHFLTLGCGLRAVEGRPGVDRWFFITPLRVRRDFVLHTGQRQPLTHERLVETLAGRGEIFREASRYRVAVDRALFGLGERYGALVELLLRLRQPQLARKLDEKLLSAALGEALTPLRGELLDAIADSFRSLDADRADLAAQQEIARAVEVFIADYRRYLRIAVRRRAAAVRSAHAAYEEAQRSLRGAERTREETIARQAALEEEQARTQGERAAAEGALKALQESPEMRGIQALQRTREETQQKENALRQTETDLAGADQRADRATSEEIRLVAEAESAAFAARTAAEATGPAAQSAAVAEVHRAVADSLLTAAPSAHASARAALELALRQRREALSHLRTLESKVIATAREHQAARSRLQDREFDLRSAETAEHEARSALAAAADAVTERCRAWTADCRELRPVGTAELAELFSAWLERREGPSPFEASLHAARTAAAETLAALNADFDAQERRHDTALALLRDEIQQLEAGVHPVPLPPPLRAADRTGRPGAPLWRVCDFRAGLTDAERAGLEAALEASGLLDAWILPDGTLLDPATNDTFLRPGAGAGPDATLARWLAPTLSREGPDTRDLTEAGLARALASIGAGAAAGEHWVGLDGRWQLGPLTGCAAKPAASHIGESARAAERLRQLADLRGRATQLTAALAALAVQRDILATRRATAEAEAQAFPDHEPLRTAGAALGHTLTVLAQTAEILKKARAAEDEARGLHDQARQRRDADAGDLGLLAWVDRLDALGGGLHACELALAALWPALASWNKAEVEAARTREVAAQARQGLDEWKARTRLASEAHAEARGRLGALFATIGASEQQILEREAAQRGELVRLNGALKQTDGELRELATTLARAVAGIERYTHERTERDAVRQEHFTRLRHLVETGLAAEAEPTSGGDDFPDWSATRLVELARNLEENMHDAPRDDAAWAEVQSQIYHRVNALDDALVPHGIRPDTSALDDGLVVVHCPFQGRMCRPGEYAAALAGDLAQRERLLNQREREVIENHLLGDVAVELQALLRRAEEWVDETNAELLARPTSTGMQLKFAWEPDPEGPPGLDAARRCLRRKNALWTLEDRAGLAAFLQQRIEAERTAAPDRTWRDHLGAALDYRKWHRFSVLRQQNDQWVRLNRRTYGTGSGGEKALALTIPQFAAAAAHYRSASPDAPRLILLDEVFVGIDSDMRAKCVGLLATFDLDFVMTSEREWGCYPTLPGLAICQLTARPGVDAVLVTRWVWNGAELREAERPGNHGNGVSP